MDVNPSNADSARLNSFLSNTESYTKSELKEFIYKFLYGGIDHEAANRAIQNRNRTDPPIHSDCPGLCTNQWREQTIAIKCYDCEYDSTCAICVDCFANSDHSGHEFRLTRTGGGCCDCGDRSSWSVGGSCADHACREGYDEADTLAIFTEPFLKRLEAVFASMICLVSEYFNNEQTVYETRVKVALDFLNELLNVTPGYRYKFSLTLKDDDLMKWMLKHSAANAEVQMLLSSTYLTLLTSMHFKLKFTAFFTQHYGLIVNPTINFDDGRHRSRAEFHLNNLSVQLFTYPSIAVDLLTHGFLDVCVGLIERANQELRINKMLFKVSDLNKMSYYLRVITDMSYLLNHEAVCKLITRDRRLQETVFRLLHAHNDINLCCREEAKHVVYEVIGRHATTAGYSIGFNIEYAIHAALGPLAEYCKGPGATDAERVNLYRNLNEFMREHPPEEPFDKTKLCRSFHKPLERFFGYVVDFDFIKRSLRAKLRSAHSGDARIWARLAEMFPGLEASPDCVDVTDAFSVDVLERVIGACCHVVKFASEIRQNLWVLNGIAIHEQIFFYQELQFSGLDVAAMQTATALLAMAGGGEYALERLFRIAFDEEGAGAGAGPEEETPRDPGDVNFKARLFYTLLNTLVNDVKHLEILSIPRRTKPEDYTRRGTPLLKMDVVNAMASGQADLADVLAKTSAQWKRHPKMMQALEEVATVSPSKVSEKTYLRLKQEAYDMIDVLWNTHEPTNHLISRHAVKQKTSLLGDSVELSPEYRETQAVLLNAVSCNELAGAVTAMLAHLSGTDIEVGTGEFESLPDAAGRTRQDCTRHLRARLAESALSLANANEAVLCCLKMLNLLLGRMPTPSPKPAHAMLAALMAMYENVDDSVYKRCIAHTLYKLSDAAGIPVKSALYELDKTKKDVKAIQKMYMKMTVEKLNQFVGTTDAPSTDREDPDEQLCILCKEPFGPSALMAHIARLSSNNMLQLCCRSAGPNEGLNYNLTLRAAMPVTATALSTCGHAAHPECLKKHKKELEARRDDDASISPDMYPCPLCKAFSDYALVSVNRTLPPGELRELNEASQALNSISFVWSRWTAAWRLGTNTKFATLRTNYDLPCPFNMHNLARAALTHEDSDEDAGASNPLEEMAKAHNVTLKIPECKSCFRRKRNARTRCPARNRHVNRHAPSDDTTELERLTRARAVFLSIARKTGAAPTTTATTSPDAHGDFGETFPAVLATSYAGALFAQGGTYLGAPNWRHANVSAQVDTKFWALYNELLSTCCLKRNSLNATNPLYAQLIKRFSAKAEDLYQTCPYDKNHILRAGMMAIEGTKPDSIQMALPHLSLFKESPSVAQVNMATVLIAKLGETELDALCERYGVERASEIEFGGFELDTEKSQFFKALRNGRHQTAGIYSIKPLRDYVFAQGPVSPYLMLSDNLAINPWSCDFIKEFLYNCITRRASRERARKLAYYYLLVATVQVLDRFVVDAVTRSYRRFVATNAPVDPEVRATKTKRDFMLGYHDRFFREIYEAGNFPCDVAGRLVLTDFQANLARFRRFNGYEGVNTINDYAYPSQLLKTLDDMIREKAEYAAMLKAAHDEHVAALVEPIPASLTPEATGEFDKYADADLEAYLVRQVARVVKAREFVSDSLKTPDPEQIAKKLEGILSPAATKRQKTGHAQAAGGIDAILIAGGTEAPPAAKQKHFYAREDLARRFDSVLERAHCNVAFHETLKHSVPDSVHTLDLIETDLMQVFGLDQHMADFAETVEKVFWRVVGHVRTRGFVGRDERMEFAEFRALLFRSVNLFLDAAFWATHCMFPFERGLADKIVYSNLYPDDERFGILFEALGLDEVAPKFTYQVLRGLFSPICKNQMRLNRLSNMEVTPPIVADYALLDVARHLPERNWDLIRTTALRLCGCCGTRPETPVLCLICGAMVCGRTDDRAALDLLQMGNRRSTRARISLQTAYMMLAIDKAIRRHAELCGGGQGLFFAPYSCLAIYCDADRAFELSSLYADSYGNSDLRRKVYGPVLLARPRLENMARAYCLGRYPNEDASKGKRTINLM